MTVSPGVFRRQVRYILKNHEVVSMEEALALLRRPVRLRNPVAVFTFDDGYRSVHQHAWPTITLEGGNVVCAAGYTACFADAGGENWPGASPLEVRRIDICGDHPTLVWKLWTHGIELRQRSGQRERCPLREERRHVA